MASLLGKLPSLDSQKDALVEWASGFGVLSFRALRVSKGGGRGKGGGGVGCILIELEGPSEGL